MGRKGTTLASKPRSKYGAVKTTVDGIVFDSQREAARYGELKLLAKAGKIRLLELQPEFYVWVNQIEICRYRADFRYETVPWDFEPVEKIVEDVKGFKTPVYRLKKKLVEAYHGVVIREIR